MRPVMVSTMLLCCCPVVAETIEIPVRVMAAAADVPPDAENADAAMGYRQPPPPPLVYEPVSDVELHRSADDPDVRIALSLPRGDVIIAANIIIDGQPFRRGWDQRVETLTQRLDGWQQDVFADKIVNYSESTGRQPDRPEVAWLLRRWGGGGPLMIVRPSAIGPRGQRQPVIALLDRDRDGTLSAAELNDVETILQRCDTDGNEVVESSELQRAASAMTYEVASPSSWVQWDRPGTLLDNDIEAATLTIGLQYNRSDGVLSVAADLPIAEVAGEAECQIAGARVRIAAVSLSDTAASQAVSIGIVTDGYPLAPWLDTDEDGRLTIRERRGATKRILSLDQDGDGQLTADELSPTVRVVLGRGPSAHIPLRKVRRVAGVPTTEQDPTQPAPTQPAPPPPDWFTGLDTNADGDISRAEFLGTDQQFSKLDGDGDGLISILEAS